MSWNACRLGDVVTLQRGHDLPDSRRQEGDVPVVSSSGITGRHNEIKAKAPGVVTGRYGTLGEVFFIEEDYWPLNTALYVKDFKGNHPRFVAYFLRNVLRNHQSDKAAVPGVNRNVLHELKVRCPDTVVQERISDTLSAYDDLIENNRRRIQLLEESARLLYKEWFVRLRFPSHEHVKVVDGVPEGWERLTFDDVCDAIGGGTPSTATPDYWDGDITWVTPSDVTGSNSLYFVDSEKKITESGLRNSSTKMLPESAILMTSRASIGFFVLANRPVCTNQGFISVIPIRPYSREFLLFHLMSRVDEFRSRASGSTFKELSKGKFRELGIVWPPELLLQQFSDGVSALLQQIQTLSVMNSKLKEARDLLLPRLMSGEITL